jgi:hypothetical protein
MVDGLADPRCIAHLLKRAATDTDELSLVLGVEAHSFGEWVEISNSLVSGYACSVSSLPPSLPPLLPEADRPLRFVLHLLLGLGLSP